MSAAVYRVAAALLVERHPLPWIQTDDSVVASDGHVVMQSRESHEGVRRRTLGLFIKWAERAVAAGRS